MSMSFNPGKIAQDIAKGLVSLNPRTIKNLLTADVRILYNHLTIVQRKIRASHVPHENTLEVNAKNRQLQRIQQAISMILGYAKKHRFRL